jgi:hypothetical protein
LISGLYDGNHLFIGNVCTSDLLWASSTNDFARRQFNLLPEDALYGTIKNGVLTLGCGFGASIRVDRDQLIVRDGGAELKFSRARCPVSRVVIVRSEGYMSVPAMRWLHEIGAAAVVLQHDGTPILSTVPRATNLSASLRRTQALTSIETRLGASIARDLIGAKIAGQIANLQWLGRNSAAAEAAVSAERIQARPSAADLLGIEGMVSAVYWQALAETPLQFGKREAVADHWKTFGARHSTITGTPRGAVTPGKRVAELSLWRTGERGHDSASLYRLGPGARHIACRQGQPGVTGV